MKNLITFILSLMILPTMAAEIQTGVVVSNATGRVVDPTNFFHGNLFGGTNVTKEVTNKSGMIFHVGLGGFYSPSGLTNIGVFSNAGPAYLPTNASTFDTAGASKFWSTLTTVAGSSASNAVVGGLLYRSVGSLYTGYPGAISNLSTVSIGGNTLTNNGDTLRCMWAGKMMDSKYSSNRLYVTFGSETIIDTGVQVCSNTAFQVECFITAITTTSQQVDAWIDWSGGNGPFNRTNVNMVLSQTNGIATALQLNGTSYASSGLTNNRTRIYWEPASR